MTTELTREGVVDGYLEHLRMQPENQRVDFSEPNEKEVVRELRTYSEISVEYWSREIEDIDQRILSLNKERDGYVRDLQYHRKVLEVLTDEQ